VSHSFGKFQISPEVAPEAWPRRPSYISMYGISWFDMNTLNSYWRIIIKSKMLNRVCITASGSWKHQLLAAMKKRRKSPNLPQDEGAPPLFWVLSEWGRAPIILGALRMGARPHYFGCSPRTNKHPSTFQTTPPPPACNIIWSPLHPLTWVRGGPHTPPPLLTSNPQLRPRGLRTAF
jgi:hypothetical protein